MIRPAGIETEYGLNFEGWAAAPDFPFEASRLIRAAPIEGAFRGWDYADEDPYQDLRGTRAASLERDSRDYAGSNRLSAGMSREEVIADTVLPNGARLYNDHNHPEYCTDVCADLRELVAQDKAGELILLAAESARNEQICSGRVRVVKNNTDYHGRSYGCHENYLTSRGTEVGDLVAALVPHLATRQVFAGAGRMGIEGGDPSAFQLSQRADFFEEVVGINTTARRPIFNTRDEPHANRRKYRRLHVIAGDANRSEWATAMKVGTTALVIDLVEAGWQPTFNLRKPVEAVRRVSHALDFATVVKLEDGRSVSALDVQAWMRDAAERWRGRDDETDWVLDEWAQVLDDLRNDPARAADRVDWAAKRLLLDEFAAETGDDWRPATARRVDFAYHLLDPEVSLYRLLLDTGRMRRLITPQSAQAARRQPPSGTRAAVRARLLQRFGSQIAAIDWDRVTFCRNGYTVTLELDEVAGPTVTELAAAVDAAAGLNDLLAALDTKRGR